MAPSEQALPPRQRSRQAEQIRPIWTGLGTRRALRAVLEKKKGWAGDEEECGSSMVNRQLWIFFPRRFDREKQRLCGAAECICKEKGMHAP